MESEGFSHLLSRPLVRVILPTVCPLMPANDWWERLVSSALGTGGDFGFLYQASMFSLKHFFVSFAFDLCCAGLLLPCFYTHLLDGKLSISTQVIQSQLKILKRSPKEFPLLEVPDSAFGNLHTPCGPLPFK